MLQPRLSRPPGLYARVIRLGYIGIVTHVQIRV